MGLCWKSCTCNNAWNWARSFKIVAIFTQKVQRDLCLRSNSSSINDWLDFAAWKWSWWHFIQVIIFYKFQSPKFTFVILCRDVCLALKEAASEPPLKTVMRYCMKMSDDNSASSLFSSETHSSIVDAKSGCQVNEDTVKLVIWFDNETGHAYRIVDLITNYHVDYPAESSDNEWTKSFNFCTKSLVVFDRKIY